MLCWVPADWLTHILHIFDCTKDIAACLQRPGVGTVSGSWSEPEMNAPPDEPASISRWCRRYQQRAADITPKTPDDWQVTIFAWCSTISRHVYWWRHRVREGTRQRVLLIPVITDVRGLCGNILLKKPLSDVICFSHLGHHKVIITPVESDQWTIASANHHVFNWKMFYCIDYNNSNNNNNKAIII